MKTQNNSGVYVYENHGKIIIVYKTTNNTFTLRTFQEWFDRAPINGKK